MALVSMPRKAVEFPRAHEATQAKDNTCILQSIGRAHTPLCS